MAPLLILCLALFGEVGLTHANLVGCGFVKFLLTTSVSVGRLRTHRFLSKVAFNLHVKEFTSMNFQM